MISLLSFRPAVQADNYRVIVMFITYLNITEKLINTFTETITKSRDQKTKKTKNKNCNNRRRKKKKKNPYTIKNKKTQIFATTVNMKKINSEA